VADRFLRPLDARCLGSPHVRHLALLCSFWDSRTPLHSLLLAHFSRFHPLLSRSHGLAMVAEQQRCWCSSTTAGPRVLLRPRPTASRPQRPSMSPPPASSHPEHDVPPFTLLRSHCGSPCCTWPGHLGLCPAKPRPPSGARRCLDASPPLPRCRRASSSELPRLTCSDFRPRASYMNSTKGRDLTVMS
jgi:hypothetical protein